MNVVELELDVDRAAVELLQAGYKVSRLPDKYTAQLAHPLDNFIEAVVFGCNDPKVVGAIMDEVDAIVGKYGGICTECGPVRRDYVPFADVFQDSGRG